MICVDREIPYLVTAIFYHCQRADINTTAFTMKPMAYFSIDALTNPIMRSICICSNLGYSASRWLTLINLLRHPAFAFLWFVYRCIRSDGLCPCSANISDSVLHVIKPSFMKSLSGSAIFCLLKKIDYGPFVFNSCRLHLRCFLTSVIGATIRAARSQFSV